MTIDPSIRALGWAVFGTELGNKAKLINAGLLKQKSVDGSFVERSDVAAEDLMFKTEKLKITEIYIELPRHYSGSRRAEAAKNSGDILALMFQVATIRAVLRRIGLTVHLVPVEKWKGNLPKEITQQRVVKHWGFDHEDHNVMDAVALGDWILRKQMRLTPVNPRNSSFTYNNTLINHRF